MSKRSRTSKLEELIANSSKTKGELVKFFEQHVDKDTLVSIIANCCDSNAVVKHFAPGMEEKIVKSVEGGNYAEAVQLLEVLSNNKSHYRECQKCKKKYGQSIVRKCGNCKAYVCKNECLYICACGAKVERPQKS